MIRNKEQPKRTIKENLKKCGFCGEFSKTYRMFDIDGKSLEEFLVCLSCGDGKPYIKAE